MLQQNLVYGVVWDFLFTRIVSVHFPLSNQRGRERLVCHHFNFIFQQFVLQWLCSRCDCCVFSWKSVLPIVASVARTHPSRCTRTATLLQLPPPSMQMWIRSVPYLGIPWRGISWMFLLILLGILPWSGHREQNPTILLWSPCSFACPFQSTSNFIWNIN